MGRGTLGDVRDGSEDPRGGLGRFVGPSWRFGTVRETLGEVRDGLRDPRGGWGQVGRPSGRFGTGWGTLWEVRDGQGTHGKVWDGSVDSR